MFFALILCIINDINSGTWMKSHRMKSSSFIDRCFLFHLTCFCLVTFPRSLVQTFRSDRSTYWKNIFFHSFYTFEVMTHFVAEESFLNKHLATLFGYNSWDLNIVAFFSAESLPIISRMDIKFQSSTYNEFMEIILLQSNARKMQKAFIVTETLWNSF